MFIENFIDVLNWLPMLDLINFYIFLFIANFVIVDYEVL